MADSLVTKKVTDLTENAGVSDNDLLMVGNNGTASLKKLKFSNFLKAIKEKLGIGAADSLSTDSKEIVGAINELNTNFEDITPRIVWAAGVTGAAFRIGKLVHIEGTLSTTGTASYTLCNIPSNLRPVQDIRPLMMCVGSGSDINKTYYGWVRSAGVANAYIVGNNVGVVTFSGTYMLGF